MNLPNMRGPAAWVQTIEDDVNHDIIDQNPRSCEYGSIV